MIKNTILLLALFLLIGSVFAESYSNMNNSGSRPSSQSSSLVVTKSGPQNGTLGETMTITITVTNSGPSKVDGYVREGVGNYEVVDQPTNRVNISDEDMLAARAPQISWALSIEAGQTKTFTYKIKPKTVGILTIGPTEVVSTNNAFRSDALLINIACSTSPSCDERIGETPLNCPQKCGGNATVAPAEAPELAYIPTAPIDGPVAHPENQTPPKAVMEEKGNMQMLLYGAIIVVLILVAFVAYKKMANKKV
ncbi:MAG: BatD family protein [Candidatus Bilamarchaeum sp.]|jgi:hypothetical protein